MQSNKYLVHVIRQNAATASSTKAVRVKSCGYRCTTPFHFSSSSSGTAQQ